MSALQVTEVCVYVGPLYPNLTIMSMVCHAKVTLQQALLLFYAAGLDLSDAFVTLPGDLLHAGTTFMS